MVNQEGRTVYNEKTNYLHCDIGIDVLIGSPFLCLVTGRIEIIPTLLEEFYFTSSAVATYSIAAVVVIGLFIADIQSEKDRKKYPVSAVIVEHSTETYRHYSLLGGKCRSSTTCHTTFKITYSNGSTSKERVEDYSNAYLRYMSILRPQTEPITYKHKEEIY